MTASVFPIDELRTLADRVCNGQQTAEDAARLEQLLCGNPEAQRFYLTRISFDTWLRWEVADQVQEPMPLSTPSAPVLGFLGPNTHAAASYFASGWPIAYLVATVVFAVGLAIGAVIHVSTPSSTIVQVVPVPGQEIPTIRESSPDTVGRVTAMTDCRWVDPATAVSKRASVQVGRQFALTAGLLEITYDSGAKVILQGPVTYDVDSSAGGYLAVGKVTARLEEKSEVRDQKSEVRSQRSEVGGQRSELASQESDVKDHKFVVRTPTAIVTDLGTEFGVEVADDGTTASHVFRGSVTVQMTSAAGRSDAAPQVLRENQSACVKKGEKQIILLRSAPLAGGFVRKVPDVTMKSLDLVDIVAGGDGFSSKRDRGIDATNGRVIDAIPNSGTDYLAGDHKYHAVEGMPFVDGVFIPDGGPGPVQIASTGLLSTEFPKTSNVTAHAIWAGGVIPPVDPSYPATRTILGKTDYASAGHGLLFLHANKGVTFDLKAIRRANPDGKLVRFRAIAGNTEASLPDTNLAKGESVHADLWVLVDGRCRFRRREINQYTGAFSVLVPLTGDDRFLTLAATDGGNGISWDWIIFGDPRLDMSSVEAGGREKETHHP